MDKDKIYTEKEAEELKLIRLKVWLHSINLDWLKSERERITKDSNRVAVIVRKNNRYSLFVNDTS